MRGKNGLISEKKEYLTYRNNIIVAYRYTYTSSFKTNFEANLKIFWERIHMSINIAPKYWRFSIL